MNRRTFALLAAAGAVCGVVRAASASTEPFRIAPEDHKKVAAEYLPQIVEYSTGEPVGTIVVDPKERFLYLVLGHGKAKRFGVGVGREGFGWSGTATIQRKAQWPRWIPPKAMMARSAEAARWPNGMPGGPQNPLGARALYLYQGEVDTLFRIHGTREPQSIGQAVSSGCIRMLNADIVELFERVELGTKVIVHGDDRPILRAEKHRQPAEKRQRKPTVAALEEPASNGPALASPAQQKAVRAAFERRRAVRRRRPSVADWLRSLEEAE